MKTKLRNKLFLIVLPLLLTGCKTNVSSLKESSSFKDSVKESSSEQKKSISSVKESSSPEISVDESQPVVTFYLNDGTEGNVYEKKNFTANRRIELPEDPTREGYLFKGWYTDKECKNAFDSKERPTESFSLYAGWVKSFTMEAEYVNLDGKAGMGYSSNVEGTSMIVKDNGSAKASNQYFVSYLYYNGANLQFDFTSAKAVENVLFVARLSSEFYDIALSDTNFKFLVNDVELKDFYCDLSGALPVSSSDKREFTNFTISENVSLKEGNNTIKLVVNNTVRHGGTMYAEAPIVDCLYLGTETDLSWNPKTDNITL